MTRYLQTLIAQARGAAPDIKPRIRSRFEPDEAAASEALSEDISDRDRIEPTAAPPRVAPTAPASLTGDLRQLPASAEPTPRADREIVRQIHEHSERVERIEHRITEHEAQHLAPLPAPERTLILERLAPPVPTADNPVTNNHRPASAPIPQQPAPEPLRQRTSTDAPSAISPRHEEPPPTAKPPPPLTHAPDFAPPRREPADRPDTTAAPEITITIGVLDIRLTQDAPGDRRPAPRAQERPDNTLPLADYLAKRSGGTP